MGDAVTDVRAAPASDLVTVAFPNEGDFTAWHDAKCAELGIPRPGYVEGDDTPAVDAQWTTAYSAARIDDGYYCVTLPADEVAADPILKGLEVWTFKNPEPAPPPAYEQPIPPTWTDDAGQEWDSTTGEPV
jgi:hypothetical protein